MRVLVCLEIWHRNDKVDILYNMMQYTISYVVQILYNKMQCIVSYLVQVMIRILTLYVVPIAFSIILLIGLVGNTLVIFVVRS